MFCRLFTFVYCSLLKIRDGIVIALVLHLLSVYQKNFNCTKIRSDFRSNFFADARKRASLWILSAPIFPESKKSEFGEDAKFCVSTGGRADSENPEAGKNISATEMGLRERIGNSKFEIQGAKKMSS